MRQRFAGLALEEPSLSHAPISLIIARVAGRSFSAGRQKKSLSVKTFCRVYADTNFFHFLVPIALCG
jgi:hypothetical protein